MLKYMGPLFVVEDIAISRYFYEILLGQKVKFDFGVNITFEGDFSFHLKSHYLSLLDNADQYSVTKKTHNVELCFETDEIEAVDQRLRAAGVAYLHEMREQPWAQRVIRLYDPDGHILEIGELMEVVILRLYRQGLSTDQVCDKTGMPREYIEGVKCD